MSDRNEQRRGRVMTSRGRNLIRLATVGLCLVLPACAKPAPPGGAIGSKADRARRDAGTLAADCVAGAAQAQADAHPELAVRRSWKDTLLGRAVAPKGGTPPAPPAPPVVVVKAAPAPKATPRPGTGALVVRERVSSAIPYATEAEAEEDALMLACEVVEKRLAELDPPVRHKVAPNEVRHEFLRKDSRTVRPPDAEEASTFARYGVTGELVYVEYDVEVTADQVRELRTQERVAGGLRVLGSLTAIALAGFLFLRADEWTRGYLTSWLAIGAATLAVAAAAALVLV
ncbi:hypothetical protein R5W24_005584 [Gemmata sp. JC717]|uniref:hypothetical protein n=1 Tax=Gemmata algarum TaxID=2975278 RepID=UPI0021BB42D3|nr:hypothetical protein [Gemmata algarum]MDY3556419.1 hypothetical protein [Gemmata algarum]